MSDNLTLALDGNNARAGAKFWELLNTMNIKGGVIMLYCKTRWMTAYKSIDDVLRVKAVLENVNKTNFIIYTIII
ncbi:unnamed protein product [Rhizophagus irregularis]|uniref:Uncharacterized protein n=1 Tax=Rhizophagus irregularis TaxID=588596 RepID=A0A915ZV10_9GLOM|nr:unnamed protein product [Rhizophagus irregularis]CAB5093039.1 unnamed protein product [Rhizophagus irregularis]CAB5391858.1 unnamed protein product [Rhizophagus irregularis]